MYVRYYNSRIDALEGVRRRFFVLFLQYNTYTMTPRRTTTMMIAGRDSAKLADKQGGIWQSLRRQGSGEHKLLDAKLQFETGGRFEIGHNSAGRDPVRCSSSRLRVSNETRLDMLRGIVLWV